MPVVFFFFKLKRFEKVPTIRVIRYNVCTPVNTTFATYVGFNGSLFHGDAVYLKS